MSNLGMELSKVLFAHEPKLLACDLGASARAAVEVSHLLGCIMAVVLVKSPDQYVEAIKAVMEGTCMSAEEVANKAIRMGMGATEH